MTEENLFYILTAGAYIIGSIPFGLVYTKLFGTTDPRTVGSGNIGATNMARAGGKKAGIITLIFDVSKGALAAYLAKTYLTNPKEIMIVCFAVFAGHVFSVFLKFKGGKGVATAFGVYIALIPYVAITTVIMFGLILFLLRYVSLASVGGAFSAPSYMIYFPDYHRYIPLTIAIFVLIFIKHWSNYQNITAGTERKFGEKS